MTCWSGFATASSLQSKPGIAWGQFVATYLERPRPDDRFAYDLKVILPERQTMSP
jgi:hypothetical protein